MPSITGLSTVHRAPLPQPVVGKSLSSAAVSAYEVVYPRPVIDEVVFFGRSASVAPIEYRPPLDVASELQQLTRIRQESPQQTLLTAASLMKTYHDHADPAKATSLLMVQPKTEERQTAEPMPVRRKPLTQVLSFVFRGLVSLKPGPIALSVTPETREQLKVTAAEHGTSINGLLSDAVNLLAAAEANHQRNGSRLVLSQPLGNRSGSDQLANVFEVKGVFR
jgi:hypothetical protein